MIFRGINLGCFLEYENTYKQKINFPAILKTLKEKNLNSIRLLVSSNLLKRADYQQILAETVSLITQNKIYCILTFGGHEVFSDDSWISFKKMLASEEEKYKIIIKFSQIWSDFSGLFRGKDEYIIFESFNELHDGQWGHGFNLFDDGKSYEIINLLNKAFIEAIGMHFNNAKLIIKPYCQQPEMVKFLDKKLLKRKNIYLGFLYYGSNYRFSISATENNFDEKAEKAFMKNLKGINLKKSIIVETGCNTKQNKVELDKYLSFIFNLFKKNSYLLWDDGCDFKYIDRLSGKWLNDIQPL